MIRFDAVAWFACRLLARTRRALLAACVAAGAIAGTPAADAEAVTTTCPPVATPLTAASLQAGLGQARDHGFLWRISKDGRTSFLYGTIHAARTEWMFPGPTVLDAVRGSDILALELDVLDPELQKRLMASIAERRGQPLPAPLLRRIERRMAAECVDAALWSAFAPEFQVASLGVMAGRRDGLDPGNAIDLVLAVLARQLGKPIASLETPESQMRALQMSSRSETVEFVTSGLDDLESGRARPLLSRLAKVWTDGNYAEMSNYAAWCDCMRTAPERATMTRLLDDRNPALADAIDALHGSGKAVFAAVGTLHMIGPRGLPALMQQRGYEVERQELKH